MQSQLFLFALLVSVCVATIPFECFNCEKTEWDLVIRSSSEVIGEVEFAFDGEFVFKTTVSEGEWTIRSAQIYVGVSPPPFTEDEVLDVDAFPFQLSDISSIEHFESIQIDDISCSQEVFVAYRAEIVRVDEHGNEISTYAWGRGEIPCISGYYSHQELCCVQGPCKECYVDSQCPIPENSCALASCEENICVESNNDFFIGTSTCGKGICQAYGEVTCVDFDLFDSCTAGQPESGPDVCDGVNTDCDDETDEDADCDDKIACTVDSCGGADGCKNEPNDSLCDDGDDCTLDYCDTTRGCVHDYVCECYDCESLSVDLISEHFAHSGEISLTYNGKFVVEIHPVDALTLESIDLYIGTEVPSVDDLSAPILDDFIHFDVVDNLLVTEVSLDHFECGSTVYVAVRAFLAADGEDCPLTAYGRDIHAAGWFFEYETCCDVCDSNSDEESTVSESEDEESTSTGSEDEETTGTTNETTVSEDEESQGTGSNDEETTGTGSDNEESHDTGSNDEETTGTADETTATGSDDEESHDTGSNDEETTGSGGDTTNTVSEDEETSGTGDETTGTETDGETTNTGSEDKESHDTGSNDEETIATADETTATGSEDEESHGTGTSDKETAGSGNEESHGTGTVTTPSEHEEETTHNTGNDEEFHSTAKDEKSHATQGDDNSHTTNGEDDKLGMTHPSNEVEEETHDTTKTSKMQTSKAKRMQNPKKVQPDQSSPNQPPLGYFVAIGAVSGMLAAVVVAAAAFFVIKRTLNDPRASYSLEV